MSVDGDVCAVCNTHVKHPEKGFISFKAPGTKLRICVVGGKGNISGTNVTKKPLA